MIYPGNIGCLTRSDDTRLFIVDSVTNGLVYCHPLDGLNTVHTVLPDQFWVLLDSLEY